MLFRVWPGHYGFYLMAPGLVVYYVFFFKAVPGLFRTEYAKTFFRWAMLVVLLVLSVRHFALSKYAYSLHTLKISSPRGTLYAFDNQRNRSLKELIEFLSANTAKSDKLVVFPEGVGVNFIADRENPLYYYSYLPIDLTRDEIQRQIIRQIDSEQVEYIALVERDTSEYGSAVFGIDCAKEIAAYIAGNYLAYKFFAGSPFESAGAGTRLFKRKSAL
jgi:hypothetical protein